MNGSGRARSIPVPGFVSVTLAARLAAITLPLTLTLTWAPPHARAQGIDMTQGGPIQITARDGMEWRQAEQVVIANGDAKAIRGNVTVTADRLFAWYRHKGDTGAPRPVATGVTGADDNEGNEVYRLRAEGNVHIYTDTDQAWGDQGTYDLDQAVLVLTGHALKLTTPNDTLTARDTMEYWSQQHMSVARGDAVVVTNDARRISADTLVAYTLDTPANSGPAAHPGSVQAGPEQTGPAQSGSTPAGSAPPGSAQAGTTPGGRTPPGPTPTGPAVPASTPSGPAGSSPAPPKQNGKAQTGQPARPPADSTAAMVGKLQRVEAFNNVTVRTVTDIVTGDRGVYVPDTDIAHLGGHVRITRGGNQINGSEAVVNMKTGIATLLAGDNGRVTGLVVPGDQSNPPPAADAPRKPSRDQPKPEARP